MDRRWSWRTIAWAASSLAWVAFWALVLIDGDDHAHKWLVLSLFLVGFPSQVAAIFAGGRRSWWRRKRRGRAGPPG